MIRIPALKNIVRNITNRDKYYAVVLFFLIYIFFEVTSWGCLTVLEKIRHITYAPRQATLSKKHEIILKKIINDKLQYTRFHSILGWSIRKNSHSNLYRSNSNGIRADRDYTHKPLNGNIRISTFGDSFTHCDEVANKDTWQEKLADLEPHLEVLNFGVGGFGLDQAFLRYQTEGVSYRPDIVIIGFMSENICRIVNTYRPFYYPATGIPLSKPRFVIEDHHLKLIENPLFSKDEVTKLLTQPKEVLPVLGQYDYFYQRTYYKGYFDFLPSIKLYKVIRYDTFKKPDFFTNGLYNKESEAFRVTTRIFDDFNSHIVKNGSIPIILVFPNYLNIKHHTQGNPSVYQPLLEYFDKKGYKYIDLMDAFKTPVRNQDITCFVRSHYTPLGNSITAEYIMEYLKTNKLLLNG